MIHIKRNTLISLSFGALFLAFLSLQIASPLFTNHARAIDPDSAANQESAAVSRFDKLSFDQKVIARNLAATMTLCRDRTDGDISASEVQNWQWFYVSYKTIKPFIGQIIEPEDGKVDCRGEEASWLQKLMELAGYGNSPDEAFKDFSVPKAPNDTSPNGKLINPDEMKKVLNDRFGTDMFNLENQDYLTYHSALWDLTNLCGAKPASTKPNVGLSKEIYVVKDNTSVTKSLYSFEGKVVDTWRNDGSLNKWTRKCSDIANILADKKYASAFVVEAARLAELRGKDPSDLEDSESANKPTAEETCQENLGLMGWLVCPIFSLADGIFQALMEGVQGLLYVNTDFTEETKASWSIIRNIATSLLILAALAMIAAQIFSFEFMSPYAIKKTLPKFIIAAILIQVSLPLFTTMLDVINVIGNGIYSLLTVPMGAYGLWSSITPDGLRALYSGTLLGLAGIFATVLISIAAPGGIFVLGIFAVGVIVSMVLALATMVLRKMLIIVLLILSPLALVAWILPGTEKLWKAWWQLYSKLLLMFPIIMITFAASAIFVKLASGANDGSSVNQYVDWIPVVNILHDLKDTPSFIEQLLILVAFFLPFFLIPATFRAAGGLFNQVTGYMDKLGGKIKQDSFGMRQKKEAYQKIAAEEQSRLRGEKISKDIADLATNGKKAGLRGGWRRIQGRALFGAKGFMPGGGELVDEFSQRTVTKRDQEEMSKSKERWTAAVEGPDLSKDEIKRFQKDVARARAEGKTTAYLTEEVTDANGTRREIVRNKDGSAKAQIAVDDYMFRTAANSSGEYGDLASFYGEAQAAAYAVDGGSGDASDTVIGLTRKSLTTDGNVTKTPYHITNDKDINARDIRSKLIENLATLTGEYRDRTTGKILIKNDSETGVYGNQVALAQAVGKDLRNGSDDAKLAALRDIAEMMKVAGTNSNLKNAIIAEVTNGDTDMAKAINLATESSGGSVLRFDKNGKVIALDTSTGKKAKY